MYLFTDKMIIAMENPNVSTNKLLKLFYQISNFTGEFTCKNQFYFYIKTSPKKLKKKIVEDKKDELSDAEVSIESIPKTQSNIESIMDEKLIETREFKKEDLQQTIDTNDLFNDKEDV